jgi:hypothetical protein
MSDLNFRRREGAAEQHSKVIMARYYREAANAPLWMRTILRREIVPLELFSLRLELEKSMARGP